MTKQLNERQKQLVKDVVSKHRESPISVRVRVVQEISGDGVNWNSLQPMEASAKVAGHQLRKAMEMQLRALLALAQNDDGLDSFEAQVAEMVARDVRLAEVEAMAGDKKVG